MEFAAKEMNQLAAKDIAKIALKTPKVHCQYQIAAYGESSLPMPRSLVSCEEMRGWGASSYT